MPEQHSQLTENIIPGKSQLAGIDSWTLQASLSNHPPPGDVLPENQSAQKL